MIRIRIFRAIDSPQDAAKYIEGHRKVLEPYGITKLTSSRTTWLDDPNTYIILVECVEDLRILGGGRLQTYSGRGTMPMEDAIAEIDPKVYDFVKPYQQGGAAEYCGLWNSKEVAGYGIGSIFLMRTGVAAASQLKIATLFALSSPATNANAQKVGYRIITELGDNGIIYYPKQDLVATALIVEDLAELSHADPFERDRIFDLRENPVQTSQESGPKGTMEIEYNLIIPNI